MIYIARAIRPSAFMLLVGGLVLCSPPGASAQQDPDRFGAVQATVIAPAGTVAKIRSGGYGWVRYWVYWTQVNPRENEYDWSITDPGVEEARAAGLKIYMNVAFPPDWALANPEKIPTQAVFEKFARAIVTRYKGKVHAWGFGSEVHNELFWAGTTVQFVQRILRPGYLIVKEIDPVPVVGPEEDVSSFLSDLLFYEKAFGRWCDIVSYHALHHSLGPDTLETRLQQLEEPTLKALIAGRDVWLTELGIMADATDCNLEGFRSDWLRDGFQLIASKFPAIKKTFVFDILAPPSFQTEFGLLYADGVSKEVWHVLRKYLTGQTPKSYLAEGATGFFDLDVAIANPGCLDVQAKVSFLKPDGSKVEQFPLIPRRSRHTIRVNDVPNVAATDVSTVVESLTGPPLIVERSMFWDRSNYYAGHTGSAVTSPAPRWYFGEGSQGFFDTYVLLANSSATPAKVTVRFLRESGGPFSHTVTVNPTSRLTLFAGNHPQLVGTSFSITVDSDQPIIAERAMYFGQSPFWNAGHESAGVPAPATNWFHAEGATGSYFDTFILVGNPNDLTATVTFKYLLESGTVITQVKTIPPQARLTVNLEAQDPLLADAAVSTTVSSDVPIVSERAMYWAGGFSSWHEAHNSFGVTETGTRWSLAEGRVGGPQAFETYILLANPSASAATVRLTFLRSGGQPPKVTTVTVKATSRFNVYANGLRDAVGAALLANEPFGVLIESVNGVPIVAERAMYWTATVNGERQVWAGGTNATATKLP